MCPSSFKSTIKQIIELINRCVELLTSLETFKFNVNGFSVSLILKNQIPFIMKNLIGIILLGLIVSSCSLFQKPSMTQEQIDEMVTALAWAIYRDDHAKLLAELSVKDTGLGNVKDKITKNKRKTL